jgi:serine/threonine protein kinase
MVSPTTSSSTPWTVTSPHPVEILDKIFTVLDKDGIFLDGGKEPCSELGVKKAMSVYVDVVLEFLKGEAGVAEAYQKRIICELKDMSSRYLKVVVIDLNRDEGMTPASGSVQEVNGLLVNFFREELKIYVPKFASKDQAYKTFRHTFEDRLSSIYKGDHPEILGLLDAFVKICRLNHHEISHDDLAFLKEAMIPRLLDSRDVLIRTYQEEGESRFYEMKISGKSREKGQELNHSPYLAFAPEKGGPSRYGSVKILPNGMISFHIQSFSQTGTYKKATYKVVSTVTTPDIFEVKVKISPKNKGTASPEILEEITREWDFVDILSGDPRFATYDARFSSLSPSASRITIVYSNPAKDLFDFINSKKSDFVDLLDKCVSEDECIYLLNQLMRLMIDIAEALDDFHHKYGYLHLDIKPENILIEVTTDGYGRVKFKPLIADFGMAVKREEVNQERDQERGTKNYLVSGAQVGRGRDGYALGYTYHELVEMINPRFKDKMLKLAKPVDTLEERFVEFKTRLRRVAQVLMKIQTGVATSGKPFTEYQQKTSLKTVVEYLNAFFLNPVKAQAST